MYWPPGICFSSWPAQVSVSASAWPGVIRALQHRVEDGHVERHGGGSFRWGGRGQAGSLCAAAGGTGRGVGPSSASRRASAIRAGG